MKESVNMINWELYVYEGRYTLSGFAKKHPRLGKNARVGRTSSMVSYKVEEDVMYYETQNTLYVCPLKYMNQMPYVDVVQPYIKELSHLREKSDCVLDHIISATACIALGKKRNRLANHIRKLQEIGQQELREREEEDNRRMYEIIKACENTVYIEMSDVETGGKLAYHMGDRFGTIEPGVHVGMFQDSVLYIGDGDNIDFRYFPNGIFNEMKTYLCSANIEKIMIKNETEGILCFDDENIEIGETRIFENKEK